MITLERLTKDQRSLILYLETCAVDFGGSVDLAHMNADDQAQAQRWAEEGLICWTRIKHGEWPKQNGRYRTHYVQFSDVAWNLAHAERRARSKRLDEKRTWRTIGEARTEKEIARPSESA